MESLRPGTLAMGREGSRWSPAGSVDPWSQIRITLMRSRSRIQVTSHIRISIKAMRIRNPALVVTVPDVESGNDTLLLLGNHWLRLLKRLQEILKARIEELFVN
jgi:hypothetical protein